MSIFVNVMCEKVTKKDSKYTMSTKRDQYGQNRSKVTIDKINKIHFPIENVADKH